MGQFAFRDSGEGSMKTLSLSTAVYSSHLRFPCCRVHTCPPKHEIAPHVHYRRTDQFCPYDTNLSTRQTEFLTMHNSRIHWNTMHVQNPGENITFRHSQRQHATTSWRNAHEEQIG